MQDLQINWDKLRKPQWKYLVKEKVEALTEDETSKMLRKLGLSRPCTKASMPNEWHVDLPMHKVMGDLGMKFKPAQGQNHGAMVGHCGAYTFVLKDGPMGRTRIHVRSFR